MDNITNEIKSAQSGDKDAMARLVEENQGLIWSIVKRFLGRGYEVEDLYQIGAMGFIKSIRNFDANFEVKLSTYAVPYILGEIKIFIREDGQIKVRRILKWLYVKKQNINKEYISKDGREPTLHKNFKHYKNTKRRNNFGFRS